MIIRERSNDNCLVQGPSLHFLHTESVSSLGLATGTARRRQITAEVVDKEYCQVGDCTVLYCTVLYRYVLYCTALVDNE